MENNYTMSMVAPSTGCGREEKTMRVLQINCVCGIRSTGRIATELAIEYEEQGYEVKIAYGREKVPKEYQKYAVRIGSELDVRLNCIMARIFDNEGFNAKRQTKKFLKWAEKYNPDLLWLHNLHGYYINLDMLFDWIRKRPQMKVKWLLHDCWAFTGHCSYFSLAECYKWKEQCNFCVQKKEYPSSWLCDNSEINFERKKSIFTGMSNLTLVTPSNWLANLVRSSFLQDYPIEVRYNTVDMNVFKPTKSNFRDKYGLNDKTIILGVASVWNERKGLGVFEKLTQMLDDSFVIVLVGLTKRQEKEIKKSSFSAGVVCISRTNNTKELAEIYSAADLFLNPSREETFGMTTIEAIACGTQVIVYKDTACEEVVNTYGGVAIEQNVEAVYKKVIELLR